MGERTRVAATAETEDPRKRSRERAPEQADADFGLEQAPPAGALTALAGPPGVMRTGDVLALQRSIGNQAIIRRLGASRPAAHLHRLADAPGELEDEEDFGPGEGTAMAGEAGPDVLQRHDTGQQHDHNAPQSPPPLPPRTQTQSPPPLPPRTQTQSPPPLPPRTQTQSQVTPPQTTTTTPPQQQTTTPQQQTPPQQGGTQTPVKSNLFTYGIKEGTGPSSRIAKGAMNVGEGILNSIIAPINPRWWYKAYADLKGIKGTDYGGGKTGTVLAVLSGLSQIAQKVSAVAGVVGLALGIAAAILGALMGAGAACALASSICGLIAFIASGVAFVIQAILVIANGVRGAWGAGGDQKKRFISDIAALIGTALGTAAGGLGVNFGGGHGLFSDQTKSVADSMVSGFSNAGELGKNGVVTGATSVASQVGGEFTKTAFGQGFGTVGDMVSEGIQGKHDPALAQRKPDGTPVQREGESESSEDQSELKSAIGQFLSGLTESKTQDRKVQLDMQASMQAVDDTNKKINMPLSKTGASGPGSEISVGDGTDALSGKLTENDKAIDDAVGKTEETQKYSKKDAGKLDKAETDVEQAEQKLGIAGEKPKKKSLFKRFKDWLVAKVLNIKQRIKKALLAAKVKIAGIAMNVLGVSGKMGELKTAMSEDREANQQSVLDAQESESSATEAEEKAKEFASTVDKK